MPGVLQLFPEAEGEEQLLLSGLVSHMTDNQAQTFSVAYLAQQKDPTAILILTVLGFVILAGIGRFYIGSIGMGILYLLTGGLCYVGTIIDVIKYKRITFQVNLLKAQQIAIMAKAS